MKGLCMLSLCIFKNTKENVSWFYDPYSHVNWKIAESWCLTVTWGGFEADAFGTLAIVLDEVISPRGGGLIRG
jgi:hypothetical protein